MRRRKSIERREHMVAASSSSSEDDLSLGANQEETVGRTTFQCKFVGVLVFFFFYL
jgi:hypothetical protein